MCRRLFPSQGLVKLSSQFHQMDEIVQGIVLYGMLVQFHSTLHWSDRYV